MEAVWVTTPPSQFTSKAPKVRLNCATSTVKDEDMIVLDTTCGVTVIPGGVCGSGTLSSD